MSGSPKALARTDRAGLVTGCGRPTTWSPSRQDADRLVSPGSPRPGGDPTCGASERGPGDHGRAKVVAYSDLGIRLWHRELDEIARHLRSGQRQRRRLDDLAGRVHGVALATGAELWRHRWRRRDGVAGVGDGVVVAMERGGTVTAWTRRRAARDQGVRGRRGVRRGTLVVRRTRPPTAWIDLGTTGGGSAFVGTFTEVAPDGTAGAVHRERDVSARRGRPVDGTAARVPAAHRVGRRMVGWGQARRALRRSGSVARAGCARPDLAVQTAAVARSRACGWPTGLDLHHLER